MARHLSCQLRLMAGLEKTYGSMALKHPRGLFKGGLGIDLAEELDCRRVIKKFNSQIFFVIAEWKFEADKSWS